MHVNGKVIVAEACPANHADYDIDISSHDFKIVVSDTAEMSSEQRTCTEAFGYFQPEGLGDEDWTDDIAETNTLAVPIGSPIAGIAHGVLHMR